MKTYFEQIEEIYRDKISEIESERIKQKMSIKEFCDKINMSPMNWNHTKNFKSVLSADKFIGLCMMFNINIP